MLRRMRERGIIHAIGIDEGFASVDAVRDRRDPSPHLLGSPGSELVDCRFDDVIAVAVDELCQALLADVQSCRLSLDVADPLAGYPDIRQDDRENLIVELARLEEADRGQAEPLLLDLGRPRRVAARNGAADVRPVPRVRKPSKQPPAIEERFHELHVHEVRAAEIGVIHGENIAGLDRRRARDDGLGRLLHGPDKDRQAEVALGDELAGLAVIDAVGAVLSLGDDRAERRPHEGQVHLVADLLKTVLDDAQRDGVELLCHQPALTSMIRFAILSTSTACPGSITVVASSCSTIAGPMKRMPGNRASR